MCHYWRGSFYEPPDFDYCDKVLEKSEELLKEAGYSGADDPTITQDVMNKFMDSAIETVHPLEEQDE